MKKLLLTILAPMFIWSSAAWPRKLEMPRTACKAAKLKLKNCHLKLGPYKIQVWKDKIFIHDGIRRSIKDLPLKEGEWVEVSLQKLRRRHFLEFVAWDLPKGEGAVESKRWYVFEFVGEHAHFRLEKVVQRRKRVGENKFHFDRLEKYGLRGEGKRKNQKVKWYVGRENGYL